MVLGMASTLPSIVSLRTAAELVGAAEALVAAGVSARELLLASTFLARVFSVVGSEKQ